MEPVAHLFKKSIPQYFENLPIPDTFGGWFRLGIRDWLYMIPLGASIGGVSYMAYRAFCPKARLRCLVNPNIHKENPKHVDTIDIESIGEKVALCRCWRSKKFPLCDGAHGKYNREFGDNTGPVVIKRNSPAAETPK